MTILIVLATWLVGSFVVSLLLGGLLSFSREAEAAEWEALCASEALWRLAGRTIALRGSGVRVSRDPAWQNPRFVVGERG
jgi:hypothetical protein